ncbi:MAG: GMC family oxidoreductase, partial [Gammaproteobacteria bacterium]|nr:GMC family oxidoreductase [Gammaproteobacteria bacterium]
SLGNHHDLVGRYYGCHIETTHGRLVSHGAAVAFDFETTRDGVYCRRKFQFSDTAQRAQRLLNSAFRLHFPNYADASHGSSVMSAIYLAKSALLPEYRAILQHDAAAPPAPLGAHAGNVLRGLPSLARFGWRWLWHRQLARRKLPYTLVANADGSFPLEFNCEQTPLAASRVMLGGERDRHGLPRVHIDWRIDAADIAACERAWALLRAQLQRSGTCRLDYDAEALPERLRRAAPLGGHHLGTARMAASERIGVVDADCAVYTLPNLLIASSAVFPTGSHANPTLSIVALALRIAARLRRSSEPRRIST